MEKDDLLKILQDDDLGLLSIKPKRAAITVDERLLQSFQQINDFYRQHNKEPESNPANILEFQLFDRLKGLRTSKEKCEALQEVDEFHLLKYVEPAKPITSVADIFKDDSFGLLDDDAASIFDLKHVPRSPMDMPEKIAQRKRCKDFDQFEHLFKQCHAELKAGIREMRSFTGEQQIKPGHFFVLHGIVCFLSRQQALERISNIRAQPTEIGRGEITQPLHTFRTLPSERRTCDQRTLIGIEFFREQQMANRTR